MLAFLRVSPLESSGFKLSYGRCTQVGCSWCFGLVKQTRLDFVGSAVCPFKHSGMENILMVCFYSFFCRNTETIQKEELLWSAWMADISKIWSYRGRAGLNHFGVNFHIVSWDIINTELIISTSRAARKAVRMYRWIRDGASGTFHIFRDSRSLDTRDYCPLR